jgi:hypothetical protein
VAAAQAATLLPHLRRQRLPPWVSSSNVPEYNVSSLYSVDVPGSLALDCGFVWWEVPDAVEAKTKQTAEFLHTFYV